MLWKDDVFACHPLHQEPLVRDKEERSPDVSLPFHRGQGLNPVWAPSPDSDAAPGQVKYEGPKSTNPLAFKDYNADEVILGKVRRCLAKNILLPQLVARFGFVVLKRRTSARPADYEGVVPLLGRLLAHFPRRRHVTLAATVTSFRLFSP